MSTALQKSHSPGAPLPGAQLALVRGDADLPPEQRAHLEQLRRDGVDLNGDILLYEEEVRVLQREIAADPRVAKLKRLQSALRSLRRARDANGEEYNGVRRFLLGQVMPGKTLFEKIEYINAQLDEAQEDERLIAASRQLTKGGV